MAPSVTVLDEDAVYYKEATITKVDLILYKGIEEGGGRVDIEVSLRIAARCCCRGRILFPLSLSELDYKGDSAMYIYRGYSVRCTHIHLIYMVEYASI